MILAICISFLLLIVLPLIYGQMWKGAIHMDGVSFIYLSGFLTVLGVFELLGPAMVLLSVPVHIQVVLDTITLLSIACGVTWTKRRRLFKKDFLKSLAEKWKIHYKSFSLIDWIIMVVFAVLLLLQVYFAFFCDIGTWRSDDFDYLVISSSAIHDDQFFATDTVTGGYVASMAKKYIFCGIYIFYTYVSVMTGLNVSVIEHTIFAVLFLGMAYSAFYLLSKYTFPKDEDRSNRFIFLILLSVVYLFGMYSHYSLSFRLFGVIWQGKAFLAVVIVPFLFAVYPRILREIVSKKRIVFLMMLSLAAISLTLGGVIAIAIIPGMLTLLYFIRTKELKKCVVYLMSVEVFPIINLLLYTRVLK